MGLFLVGYPPDSSNIEIARSENIWRKGIGSPVTWRSGEMCSQLQNLRHCHQALVSFWKTVGWESWMINGWSALNSCATCTRMGEGSDTKFFSVGRYSRIIGVISIMENLFFWMRRLPYFFPLPLCALCRRERHASIWWGRSLWVGVQLRTLWSCLPGCPNPVIRYFPPLCVYIQEGGCVWQKGGDTPLVWAAPIFFVVPPPPSIGGRQACFALPFKS